MKGDTEYNALREIVYRACGLIYEERKRDVFLARVQRRIKARGCDSLRDYLNLLRANPGGDEIFRLIEELTTNETYFFRDYPQLTAFADEALPLVAQRKRDQEDKNLSIWSAACSTGDEPYTLAIILRACLDDFSRWKIRLLATDIDRRVLAVAQQGVYSARAVQDVPREYLTRYFIVEGDSFRVADNIRKMVHFRRQSLMDSDAMRSTTGFDFIFCRNVLIYFDDAGRKAVLDDFFGSLLPGGFLFLGHSESVARISADYEAVSVGRGVLYRKPFSGLAHQASSVTRTSTSRSPGTGRAAGPFHPPRQG